jgi:hypothetical protein
VLQPDFTLAALPDTARLPEHKLAFLVTHRFIRPLGRGDLGDLANDFFALDNGAQIGLEMRYGLFRGTQVGVYRTSDRSIEVFGQQSVLQQKDARPIGLDVIVGIEGQNNLRAQRSGEIGVLVSRKISTIAAVYVEPIFVSNTSPNPVDGSVSTLPNNTTMLGLGGRFRIRPKTYIVAEITPRLSGYKPGANQMSFAIESRVGGHTFQLNFSNGLGTTLGQLARGGFDNSSWFMGFNISRKFY